MQKQVNVVFVNVDLILYVSSESHQQVKVILVLGLVLMLEKVILVLVAPKVESNGQVLVCPARFHPRTLKFLKPYFFNLN